MARQAINTGSGPGDVSAETVRQAFTKLNAMTVDIYGPRYNLIAEGAAGNSTYNNGGGTDDSTSIQASLNAAGTLAAGNPCEVLLPGPHTYSIGTTLDIPEGVHFIGVGGRDGQGSSSPPTLVWTGAANGIVVRIQSSTSMFSTKIANMNIRGADNLTKPGYGIVFDETGGGVIKIDSGTILEDVWIQLTSSHAIDIRHHGATNFSIIRPRFDSIGGYAIHADLNGTGKDVDMQIQYPQYVGGAVQGQGFMWMDGDAATTFGTSFVRIVGGGHLEISGAQDLVQTFAAGANPYDKRGVFRFGVTPALGNMQHQLEASGLQINAGSGYASFSIFQITATSGTTAEASDCVGVTWNSCKGLSQHEGSGDADTTNEIRVFGGMVPAARRYPWSPNYRHGHGDWGYGKDNNSEGLRSYISKRHGSYMIHGLAIQWETVAELATPIDGAAIAAVTNANATTRYSVVAGGGSNHVLVFYDGSNWLIL